MSDPRLDPPLSATGYAVRAPLARWLAAEARRAAEDLGPYRLLDVGCGEMPYLALFQPHVREESGWTPSPTRARAWSARSRRSLRPTRRSTSSSARRCSSTSTTPRAVSPSCTASAPGGRVLLSTHGTMVYHPNPVDLWRWTGPGLERLFAANGAWDSITVSAGPDRGLPRDAERALPRPRLPPRPAAAASPTGRLPRQPARRARSTGRLRRSASERPGTLVANYHVVAEKPA